MSRLTWTERKHYGGVDRGAVYSRDGSVEAWNGLISVAEKPTDIRQKVRYRDGVKTVNQRREDSFTASATCFTYPDLLLNPRAIFDFTYRVRTSSGYEIHLVYNALARSTGSMFEQQNPPKPSDFTFDIWTRPRPMPLERLPSAHLVIDSSEAYPPVLSAFEDSLYGTDFNEPKFPSPDDLVAIFDVHSLYQVIDNGDGTFTLEAPDGVFEWLEATKFEVDWPRVRYIAEDTYVLRNG